MVDEQAVIRALTKAAEAKEELHPGSFRNPVITISRSMGSGGNEIGQLVAQELGIPCYCKEVLDNVAKEAHVHQSLMNKLHERLTQASDAWLYSLVFGKNVTRDDYLHRLVTTVRGLYQSGGVIMGRGANVILAGRNVLRVRITGSVEACAKRLAMQENIEIDEAKRRVRASNKARSEFAWKMFKKRCNDPIIYDLTINTDHFLNYGHVADIIIQAMCSMGFDKHPKGTSRK